MRSYRSLSVFYLLIFLFCSWFCVLTPDISSGKAIKRKISKFNRFERKNNVYLPKDYNFKKPEKKIYKDKYLKINFFAQKFAQGKLVYFEVFKMYKLNKSKFDFKKLIFNKRPVPFKKYRWGYRGFFPVHPDLKTGNKKVKIEYHIGKRKILKTFKLRIRDIKYPFYRKAIDLGKYSDVENQVKPEIQKLVKICAAKKQKVFKLNSDDLKIKYFSHPRNMHYITSPYWSKRTYMRYKDYFTVYISCNVKII